MTTPNTESSIVLDQKTIEQALAQHLLGETFADPEMRDRMLKDLALRLLAEKERPYSNDSLLVEMVKKAVGERVKEITHEWLELPGVQETIRAQVQHELENGIVAAIVKSAAESLSARIMRGY